MQKLLLPLCLAAILTVPAYAQVAASTSAGVAAIPLPTVLTLPTALDRAMQANPDIAVALREVQANDAVIRQAGMIPNPDIAALVEDTHRATRTTMVQLNQPIELGGKRSTRIAAAERSRDAALAELMAKRADIRAQVIADFYDVLAAQERHQLAQSSVELAQRATTVAAKRVAAGKVSPVEATKAKVAESGVRVELAQASSELAAARRRLAANWGSSVPEFERVEGQITSLPPVGTLNALIAKIEQSPDLTRARHEVARRQALSEVERSRQTPNVTLNIGAKRDEQLGRTQAIFGVTVPLPLFDRNQGNLQEALSRTDKARNELTATQVRLTSELSQAYERFNAAREEVELLRRDIVPGAQSAYDAATKGYEYGKFSFLDVLDAQRTFFQAQSQYLRALSVAHRAAAEIGRIVGTSEVSKQEQQ
jgi:cobalt-zinc-cadmium efflux system outer membrane protein